MSPAAACLAQGLGSVASAQALRRNTCTAQRNAVVARESSCQQIGRPRVALAPTATASSAAPKGNPGKQQIDVSVHAVVEAGPLGHANASWGWQQGFREAYRLGEFLGRGSFGTVNLAVEKATGREYAVKCIPKEPQGLASAEARKRSIEKEVDILKALQHCDHVIGLKGIYEDDDHVYIVTEACYGQDLQKYLQKHGKMREHEAAQVIHDLLEVLVDCHSQGIIYADVKPANFLLKDPYPIPQSLVDPYTPNSAIKLRVIDFGCSQRIMDGERQGKKTGTPLYMAPELFMRYFGTEADLWGVGMLLYQLLDGNLPWFPNMREKTPFHVMSAILSEGLTFDGPAWGRISDDAKDLIRQLLDRDYNTRITSEQALQHPWLKSRSQGSVARLLSNTIALTQLRYSQEQPAAAL